MTNDKIQMTNQGQNPNDENQSAGAAPEASNELQADLDATNKPASAKASAGKQLKDDFAEANKKIQDLTETAKRALADLQNYRRRVEEERAGFVQFANVALILELLPILDSFQRAFAQVPEEILKSDWFKGALAIEQQLVAVVKKQGVTEMPSQIGKKLDPKIHEAVATGTGEKDTVIEEFEKGYLLGDKVIRPAKVKVGSYSTE